MSYSVFSIPPFERQLKRLLKKYPSLKSELYELIATLEADPFTGTSLGNNCYKIRVAIRSKGKGRSGGARVITHVHIRREAVFLLNIYDKSEKDTLSQSELAELLGQIQSQ